MRISSAVRVIVVWLDEVVGQHTDYIEFRDTCTTTSVVGVARDNSASKGDLVYFNLTVSSLSVTLRRLLLIGVNLAGFPPHRRILLLGPTGVDKATAAGRLSTHLTSNFGHSIRYIDFENGFLKG